MVNDVTFIEEGGQGQKNTSVRKSSITRFFINNGLAKTEAGANLYMIAITVICIGIIVYMNTGESSTPPTPEPPTATN